MLTKCHPVQFALYLDMSYLCPGVLSVCINCIYARVCLVPVLLLTSTPALPTARYSPQLLNLLDGRSSPSGGYVQSMAFPVKHNMQNKYSGFTR